MTRTSPPVTFQPGTPSRPSQLRQANARGLLQLLQRHAPCSKADLVRFSGLSAPTVSSGVAHLEHLGLIEHIGEGESSGGRPPGLLGFHARHGYVAAADIGGTRLRMMLADLAGQVVAQSSVILDAKQKTPDGICCLIAEGLKSLCKQNGTPLRKVLHLTAGAPGITNAVAGVVLSAPNLHGWDNVPLRALLQQKSGIPCLVENDTNLAAIGEHWRGAAVGIADFIFIALGTGIGAGIFINGQLHRGAQWSAGEIGYFGVSGKKRGPMKIRELGQLEQAIGGLGIEQEWRRQLDMHVPESNLSDLQGLKAAQIFDLAAEGDAEAAGLLRWVSTMLVDVIVDTALLLNPETVVLGGGVGSHPELCRATAALLQRHEFARPLLRSSSLGTHAQLQGAIRLGLDAVEARLLE